MISSNLNIAKSSNSIPTWAIPFPSKGISMFIDNGTPISITVPEGCNVAIFEYNSGPKVFVNEGTSVEALPVLGSNNASQARINPTGIWATPGSTLHFQTLNTSGDVLTIGFYNNQETS